MSGYVIYGIKYTKGRFRLINDVEILVIGLMWEKALEKREEYEIKYRAKEDDFHYWEIRVSEELSVY